MKILVLNAGSSSQKSRLYEIGESIPDQAPEPLWEANADWTKEKDAADLKIKTAGGPSIEEEITRESRPVIIERMLKTLWSGKTRVIDRPADVAMIGHRIVHGGADYRESVLITP